MATKKTALKQARPPQSRLLKATAVRVPPDLQGWISGLAGTFGIAEANVVRRCLDDARASGWTPAHNMSRLAKERSE